MRTLARPVLFVAALVYACAAGKAGNNLATRSVRSSVMPHHSGAKTAAPSPAAPNYIATAANLRHWEAPVVRVRVVTEFADNGRSKVQTEVLLARALALWNARLGKKITLVASDSEEAEVSLGFVKPGSLAGGAIGRTDVTFRLADQVLTHAVIRVNAGLTPEEFVQVAAHELGHALGIQGHSDDPRDLMYIYAHIPAAVTDRDYNTMAYSYNLAAAPNATVAGAKPLSRAEGKNNAELVGRR